MKMPRLPAIRFQWLRRILRWLVPGIRVKRWMLLVLGGVIVLGVGLALMLHEFYVVEYANGKFDETLSVISLRLLPGWLRILIIGGVGLLLTAIGIWELNRSLMRPYMLPGSHVVDKLTEYHRLERGPRIVAIGGGHGLSTLLRGLKEYTHHLTAVVTVADDGGSSGRLRASLGILPPGDIRNCLAALSRDEDLLAQLFRYRFSGAPDLDGHSFGNLFISALSDITGSFEMAVAESGRVLSVHGRVLPSTLHDVRLLADVRLPDVANEVRVEGESRIPEAAGVVRRVWLDPNDAPAFPPVIQSLLNADVIVVGPGSLYTSLLPNLLVRDLLGAMRASRALKVYVCNIVTQAGETQSYTCGDHLGALEEHVGEDLFDVVLCNDNYEPILPDESNQWVQSDEIIYPGLSLYTADLVDYEHPWRHDPGRLAQVLVQIFYENAGLQ